MFTGSEIVETLEQAGVTHIVWLPDSTLGLWESDLASSPRLSLVRVCREGEAWPLAAGLLVAGKSPLVMMQTTGFFESADAMRNVCFDLRLPIFALIGARNWLIADSQDSAKRFARAVLQAWELDWVLIDQETDKPKFAEHYRSCMQANRAGVVLLGEGSG